MVSTHEALAANADVPDDERLQSVSRSSANPTAEFVIVNGQPVAEPESINQIIPARRIDLKKKPAAK